MLKKSFYMTLVLTLCLIFTSVGYADSLYGSIKFKDGSKANGVAISTSWNSKKGYAKNGKYNLDFGGTVGKSITVYVKGKKIGTVKVRGNTQFDIVIR